MSGDMPDPDPLPRIVDPDWSPCSACNGYGRVTRALDEDWSCYECMGTGLAQCPCGEHPKPALCDEWLRRAFVDYGETREALSYSAPASLVRDGLSARRDALADQIVNALTERIEAMPAKNETAPRKMLSVYFSPSEYDAVTRAAAKAKLPTGTFARRLLLERSGVRVDDDVEARRLAQYRAGAPKPRGKK